MEDSVIDWLLEENQPSIRYLTLTQLLHKSSTDSEVRETQRKIPEIGWAASILANRNPAGWWANEKNHYSPRFTATTWIMLILSDLGLTRENPAIRDSCELWTRMRPIMRTKNKLMHSDEPGTNVPGSLEPCFTGGVVRALIHFGYYDDPRVRRALEWMVTRADPRGGWSHFQPGRSLDCWEPLSALAALPRPKRTASMQRAAERGAEFYLERELHRQGDQYTPWYRFHYPNHYYYDILVGLELVTSLGYADDPRLKYALSLLEEKRRPDGRWNLDAINPDVEIDLEKYYRDHPKEQRSIPFALEKAGEPSKMITLRALLVLDRVGS